MNRLSLAPSVFRWSVLTFAGAFCAPTWLVLYLGNLHPLRQGHIRLVS